MRPTLEDAAFGDAQELECDRRARGPRDPAAMYMFPATVTVAMVAIVSYLLAREQAQPLASCDRRRESNIKSCSRATHATGWASWWPTP